ncbi:hypothetical protein MATL_G00129040 [Megalops atlanticus]|uniref:Dolichol-phosphate mannosyltransferase subunit 3 n=1 Tax=Megalops atlanticus TaxID=7932 RepID=A0A9D3Q0D8_MEGAT|nr:hypothetical protein MATL_G00129040 [Megalops atlanticus]
MNYIPRRSKEAGQSGYRVRFIGYLHRYKPTLIMTKLLEWLLGTAVVGIAWGLLTFDLLDLKLPQVYREVVWPMPVYLLVAFGCYSLATVGYRVATFNDCEEAAKELQAQIQEAKSDLVKKGLKF